ncbi:MAG: NAD(+)/NADH kinase [candidate division Zixibacteria bacterium]|nr:NAD(+)/NADH kinase [candidate division Zixibacteria bacterium]
MRFGITANLKRPDAENVTNTVIRWIDANGHDYRVCQELRGLDVAAEKVVDRHQLPRFSDYVISLGGDGTLLGTARLVGDSGIPILGINLGSLGFLTQVTSSEAERSLDLIAAGEHRIEERMLLKTSVLGTNGVPEMYALNEVVIDRGDVARLIELNLHVNEEFICTYRADGLIVSTPTGSTAYNAAVGGPILNPMMHAIVIAPMAPQSLAARPLLFSGDDRVLVKVSSRHKSALLTIDGQVSVPLVSGDEVSVQQAAHTCKLVTLPQHSFYEILRNKLNWAVLPRTDND